MSSQCYQTTLVRYAGILLSDSQYSAGEESHKYHENYFYHERLASACLCYTSRVGNPESQHIHVLEPEGASGLREHRSKTEAY